MRNLYQLAGAVALAMLLLCFPAPGILTGVAFAQTAAASASSVDLSGVVNQVIELLFAAIAGGIGYLFKRAVVALEAMNVLKVNEVHGSAIDDAVSSVVSFVQTKLEALIDPQLKASMTNSVLAEAAQMVAATAPNAIAALGLTPATIQAKIQLALGDPLAASTAASASLPAAPAAPAAAVTVGQQQAA